jgi:dTDP-glucose pyrophosphorylase
MRAIIPCAGFGTRMNMRYDQSKEMLPAEDGYIIDYSLKLCEEYGLTPLIITRKDKTDLHDYIHNETQYEIQIITPYGEWPDTILMSQDYWHEHNILILPDTRFKPTNVIQLIKNDLELGAAASIALHSVTDTSKWCIVKDYDLTEKPTFNENGWAMGLIGFNRSEGARLFNGLRVRGSPYRLLDASFQYLDSFQDITRP